MFIKLRTFELYCMYKNQVWKPKDMKTLNILLGIQKGKWIGILQQFKNNMYRYWNTYVRMYLTRFTHILVNIVYIYYIYDSSNLKRTWWLSRIKTIIHCWKYIWKFNNMSYCPLCDGLMGLQKFCNTLSSQFLT